MPDASHVPLPAACRPPPPFPPPPANAASPKPPPPSPANTNGACASVSAAGDCCSIACFAAANPNIALGVSFQSYSTMCLSGGLGCIGNTGCRMCRLKAATHELHLPVCPACVCHRYNLATDLCDPLGQSGVEAGGSTPGPPPPSLRPSPPPRLLRPPPPSPATSPPPPLRRPPPPVLAGSPPPPPGAIDWGTPILIQTFTGQTSLPPLFQAEVDCWVCGYAEWAGLVWVMRDGLWVVRSSAVACPKPHPRSPSPTPAAHTSKPANLSHAGRRQR